MTVKLRATTALSHYLLPLFEALAEKAGATCPKTIKVSVTERADMPISRAGVVYIPSSMRSMLREEGRGPIIFAHSFLHELQHSIDYHDEVTLDWDRDQHEAHARAAEKAIPDEEIIRIVEEYRAARTRKAV